MARRRVQAPTGGDGAPGWLFEFRLADWRDRVPPEPGWYAEQRRGYPWELFKAKLLWMDARQEWAREHGTTVVELFRGEQMRRLAGMGGGGEDD